MRHFRDVGSIFGGGGSSAAAKKLKLEPPPKVDPDAAKKREEALRANEAAIAAFRAQEQGFGGSERGTIVGSPLAQVRGETASSVSLRAGEFDVPVAPPSGPETVDVPPISDVVSPAPKPTPPPAPEETPSDFVFLPGFGLAEAADVRAVQSGAITPESRKLKGKHARTQLLDALGLRGP